MMNMNNNKTKRIIASVLVLLIVLAMVLPMVMDIFI